MPRTMPVKLREFLKGEMVTLKKEEAESIWEYLDEDPDAIHDMIEMVVSSNGLDSGELDIKKTVKRATGRM